MKSVSRAPAGGENQVAGPSSTRNTPPGHPDGLEQKRAALVANGYPEFSALPVPEFRKALKYRAEQSLFFFNRWIMDFKDLATIHQEVCRFLQDVETSRRKLLMIPVGCLKTSCATHGQSLHFLIQPAERNIYFPGKLGANTRGLIGCESEGQGKKNLGFIKDHLAENHWLRWLWPEICWENPKKESPHWSDTQIQVRRTAIYREPSITAIGTDTAVMGDHYDWVMLDDIATLNAWQSQSLMDRAKNWRKAARSRVDDPRRSIEIGVATYWGEVYDDWQKDVSVEVMLRSIIEDGKSIWPERFPMDVIEKLRKEDGDILFSMMRMNRPVRDGFTALDWDSLREFKMAGDAVSFREELEDKALVERKNKRNMPRLLLAPPGQPMVNNRTMRPLRLQPDPDFVHHLGLKYPDKVVHDDE